MSGRFLAKKWLSRIGGRMDGEESGDQAKEEEDCEFDSRLALAN